MLWSFGMSNGERLRIAWNLLGVVAVVLGDGNRDLAERVRALRNDIDERMTGADEPTADPGNRGL